jgi:hypothetical protein
MPRASCGCACAAVGVLQARQRRSENSADEWLPPALPSQPHQRPKSPSAPPHDGPSAVHDIQAWNRHGMNTLQGCRHCIQAIHPCHGSDACSCCTHVRHVEGLLLSYGCLFATIKDTRKQREWAFQQSMTCRWGCIPWAAAARLFRASCWFAFPVRLASRAAALQPKNIAITPQLANSSV